jgi:hypothetical protein
MLKELLTIIGISFVIGMVAGAAIDYFLSKK